MDRTWGRATLHPVDALDGIGAVTAEHLTARGLGTVEELATQPRRTLEAVARQVPGISAREMRASLLPQAWLHLLGDDGAEAAKPLVEAGFDSYIALVAAPTARIANLLGDAWDRDRAAQLQLAAAKATWTFQVLVRTLDGEGDPIQSTLEIGGVGFDAGERVVARRADAAGWVLSPPLRRDRPHQLSLVTGTARRSATVRAGRTQVSQLTLTFSRQPRRAAPPTAPPRPHLMSGREVFVTERRSLDQLADGVPLRLVAVSDGTALLRGLFRQFAGGTVSSVRVDPPADALPRPTPDPGAVLVVENGALRLATDAEQASFVSALGARLAGVDAP